MSCLGSSECGCANCMGWLGENSSQIAGMTMPVLPPLRKIPEGWYELRDNQSGATQRAKIYSDGRTITVLYKCWSARFRMWTDCGLCTCIRFLGTNRFECVCSGRAGVYAVTYIEFENGGWHWHGEGFGGTIDPIPRS
jgi:hypothetical protein